MTNPCLHDGCPHEGELSPRILLYASVEIDPFKRLPSQMELPWRGKTKGNYFLACRWHAPTTSLEEVMPEASRKAVNDIFEKHGAPLPDWSRTEVQWVPLSELRLFNA